MSIVNAACMTCASAPGTGTVTLGSAVGSFLTLANAGCVDGQAYSYSLVDGSAREGGVGTYSSGGTFTRDIVHYSTAGGTTKIDAGASAVISITALADNMPIAKLASGTITTSAPSVNIALSGDYPSYNLSIMHFMFDADDLLTSVISFDNGSTWLNDTSNNDSYLNYAAFTEAFQNLTYNSEMQGPFFAQISILPGSDENPPMQICNSVTESYPLGSTINPDATVTPPSGRATNIRLQPKLNTTNIIGGSWTLYGVR